MANQEDMTIEADNDEQESILPENFDPFSSAPDQNDPFAAPEPFEDDAPSTQTRNLRATVDPTGAFNIKIPGAPQPKRQEKKNAPSPLDFLTYATEGQLMVKRLVSPTVTPQGIYKPTGKNVGVGNCGFLPISPPEELYETLKEEYGGGRYEITHIGPDGKFVKKAIIDLPQAPKPIANLEDSDSDLDDDDDRDRDFNAGIPGMIPGMQGIHGIRGMGMGMREPWQQDMEFPRRPRIANTFRSEEADEAKAKIAELEAKLELERRALQQKLEDEKEQRRQLEHARLQEKHNAEMSALKLQIEESIKSAKASPQLELVQERHRAEKERLEMEMRQLTKQFEQQIEKIAREVSQPKTDPMVVMLETMRAQQAAAEAKWQQEREEQRRRDERDREERKQLEELRLRKEEDERRRREEERRDREEKLREEREEARRKEDAEWKRREEERREREERAREEREVQRRLEEAARAEAKAREEREEARRKEEREEARRREEREEQRRREEREEAFRREEKRREEERRREEQLREERRMERERLERLEEQRRQEQRELEARRLEDQQRQFQMMVENQKALQEAKSSASDPANLIRNAFSLANEIRSAIPGEAPAPAGGDIAGTIEKVATTVGPPLAALAAAWLARTQQVEPAPVAQAQPQIAMQPQPQQAQPTEQQAQQPDQTPPQPSAQDLAERKRQQMLAINKYTVIIKAALAAKQQNKKPDEVAMDIRTAAGQEGAEHQVASLRKTKPEGIVSMLSMVLASGMVGGNDAKQLGEFVSEIQSTEGAEWLTNVLAVL